MSYLTLWHNADFDRLFDSLWQARGEKGQTTPTYYPFFDWEETDKAYRVSVDLPGVSKKDLQIELKDSTLHLSGERKSVGKFQRTLRLPPDVAGEKIEATLQDGVLSLTLAKAESALPKLIPVSGGEN